MRECLQDKALEKRISGGQGFGDTILNFALAFDLIIANTLAFKKEEHLITYK